VLHRKDVMSTIPETATVSITSDGRVFVFDRDGRARELCEIADAVAHAVCRAAIGETLTFADAPLGTPSYARGRSI